MDLVVPYIHSEKLHEAMEDKGIPTKLVPIRWKGHGWEDPDATQTAAKETLAFLKKHLADPEAKTK
jgi:dipeptidyl aminopeptidase/acylaminoacyl peptidase